MLARAAVVLALLLSAGVYGSSAGSAETIVPRKSLTELPLALGEWRGREASPFADDVLAQLGVDDYINRQYQQPGSAPIGIYVGYYESQRQGDTIHSPQNCLPGSGWRPIETRIARIARRRPRGSGESVRDSEGNRSPGCLLLVSGTWPGHRQRVHEQGAAHARCGAAASNERGTRAVDYPGCDDPRGGDARAHRLCHACVSVVGCTPAMKHMSRRFAAVALVTLVALAAPACSRDPQKQAEKYVASGDAYVARKQFNQAAIEYKNAIKAKPERADIHYKLAKVYEAQADPGKAYQEYARTADLEPSNLDAQLQAGMLLLSAGEFEAARTRAELALKAAPDSAPANILLGNALSGLNEPAKAIKQIEQALSLDPSYAPAWTALGAAQFLSGTRERAGEAFAKAVTLAPRSMEARLALANYEWARGDMAAAEQTLQAALSIDPGSSAIHRALALLYLSTRRAPQAEAHFKALASEPGGQLALADYYAGIGNRDAAMAVAAHPAEGGRQGRFPCRPSSHCRPRLRRWTQDRGARDRRRRSSREAQERRSANCQSADAPRRRQAGRSGGTGEGGGQGSGRIAGGPVHARPHRPCAQ